MKRVIDSGRLVHAVRIERRKPFSYVTACDELLALPHFHQVGDDRTVTCLLCAGAPEPREAR